MKITFETKSFISKEGNSIKPSIVMQNESSLWYFVVSECCVSMANFVLKFPSVNFFVKNKVKISEFLYTG